ncbi:wd40 repeat-containing protein [Leptolyngbya sp. Heron Island J]|uniref:nSTAND1 domain-containing NTPase n=1 Tax=Leptolyngbya sp. Heron Island J TaxID=1385935 RepID=UPI0003B9D326|nr:wd40 repeat-containing protein [Leptolyngbya sp. Heron Island J]ESA32109.1 wd40 repeat-containing protein [Leptolyngbya sp. Heron Island J]
MSDVPHNEEHLAVNQTNQQNVATNYGHVIWRVENLSIYYSTPRAAEPDVEPISNSELGPNPYRGLRAFREEDHTVFFGRRQQTYKLWKMLKALYDHPSVVRFLPVYGPSGSGKSSLVRAGLLPVIGQHSLSSQEHTRVAILEPRTQPLKGLALALARMATGDDSPVAKAREFYRELQQRNEREQYDGLWRIVRSLPGTEFSPVIVAVDQFEEIYSQCKDKRQRLIFINNLLTAAADKSRLVIVVVTLRSDFLGETQSHPWLNRLFSKHGYLVPTMNEVELRQAISKPAEKARHPLDAATVTLLVQETQQREGALPLLQVALSDIWNGLRDGMEPGQTLQEIGGVGGALAKKAEAIFQTLTLEQQAIARRVFLGVIQLGEGTRDTRRRAQVSSLVAQQTTMAQVREVIELFAWREARLLTFAADNEGNETVEVTHEALIEHWQRLNNWLDDNRDNIRFHRQLEAAVQNWQTKKQAEGLLWRPPDLSLLTDFYQRFEQNMTLDQLTFFQKSQLAEKRRRQMRQLGFSALLVGLLITITTTVLSVLYAQAANSSRKESLLQIAQTQIETSAKLNAIGEPFDGLINALQSLKYLEKNKIDNHIILAQVRSKILSSFLGLREIKYLYQNNTNDISFSPDGSVVATAGESTAVWNLDGKLITEFELQGFEHLGDAKAIRFSPDGEVVAVAGDGLDGTGVTLVKPKVLLYEINGTLIDSIEIEDEQCLIHDMRFSPDGKILAVACNNAKVLLWNYPKRVIVPIPKHIDNDRYGTIEFLSTANIIDFSPNRNLIITTDFLRGPQLWNLDGKLITSLRGHKGTVYEVHFSPDGNVIVTSGEDETVKLWTHEGQLITSLESQIGAISDISFSPSGKIIAIASLGGSIRLLSKNGQPITSWQGHSDRINEVRFSADGHIVATASQDGTAKLWDLDGKLIASFQEHGIPISGVRLNQNKGIALTLTDPYAGTDPYVGGKATMWDIDKTLISSLHEDNERAVSFDISPDGKTLATDGTDGVARLWDLDGQLITSLEKHSSQVYQVIFSPDGKTIATASADKTVKLWNYSGEILASLSGESILDDSLDDFGYIRIGFSPDGNTLVTTEDFEQRVKLWDLDGQPIASLEGKSVNGFGEKPLFSPDGSTTITAGEHGRVYLWNQKGQLISSLDKHVSEVRTVTFSSDGSIATASEDGMIFLWNQDGQFITSLKQHDGRKLYNPVFSPDGSFIAATVHEYSSRDNINSYETKLWNLNGKPFTALKGSNPVFSPNGNIIATQDSGAIRLWGAKGNFIESIQGHKAQFSDDGNIVAIHDGETIGLWNINRTPLIFLEEQNSEFRFMSFVPNRDLIITNNSQGIVRLWQWNPDQVVKKACQQVSLHFSKNPPNLEEDSKSLCIDTASVSESIY